VRFHDIESCLYGFISYRLTTIISPLAASKKVKLATTKEEREIFDQFANLYGIIRAVDGLERAFSTNGMSALH
jgi:hypothetical protein